MADKWNRANGVTPEHLKMVNDLFRTPVIVVPMVKPAIEGVEGSFPKSNFNNGKDKTSTSSVSLKPSKDWNMNPGSNVDTTKNQIP